MPLPRMRLYGALCLLLLMLPLMALAQDTPPTPFPTTTPIPIEGATDEAGAPALQVPTLQATQTTPTPVTPGAAVPEATAELGEATPLAQGSTCPTLVQESFTAVEQICTGLASGEACLGNGTVSFTSTIEGLAFASPGDRAQLTAFDELQLLTTNTPGGIWSVVTAQLELNSTDGDVPVTAQMLLFGDVRMVDEGQTATGTARDATVIAQRGMNVRRTPENTGVVVWQLSAGEVILATGRTPDQQWIRIVIPNRFAGTGWVYAPYLEVAGGADALPTVTVNSPPPELEAAEFGPMQAFQFSSADIPESCEIGLLDSGLLLQSPNGLPDAVRLQVNGAEIQLNGTIYLTAQPNDALQVHVLEGVVTVIAGGSSANAAAGSRVRVALDGSLNAVGTPQTETFDASTLADLPIRLLTRQFALPSGAAPVVEESTDGGFATSTTEAGAGFGTAAPTATPQTCTLTAPDVRNVRSGPSVDFEVVRVLQAGDTATGIGRASDDANFIWYEISTGGWVRFDAVNESGSCSTLPVVEAPEPPQPSVTPTPEAPPSSLNSSVLGDAECPGGQVSTTGTSDGSQLYIELGGTWTVTAGTTVTFTTQGGQLRPEYGDFIRIVAEDGTVIASSADGRTLTVTFTQDWLFRVRLSAANGDVVAMAARCDA